MLVIFVKRPVTQIRLYSAFCGNNVLIFTGEICPFEKHPHIHKSIYLLIEIKVQCSYFVENKF